MSALSSTDAILKRLLTLHPKLIDLTLDRMGRLLDELGRPQDRLPPVIHVAGTNGKGSTVACLRAFLEAAGKKVHVYTSPHLVHFNERIRLAGRIVSTRRLNQALEHCERVNAGRPITYFEITTAVAFYLFAEEPADFLLLEVGLGGRFDATNVVDHPLGTVITPVSIDHIEYLGSEIAGIAREKAGILKRGAPAVIARQVDAARATILEKAKKLGNPPPKIMGEDFDAYVQNGRMVFQDEAGLMDLPLPRLAGPHQVGNAGVAIAAARTFGLPVTEKEIAEGLRQVDWPGRLAPVKGRLSALLQPGQELWLDGGHNEAGGGVLAEPDAQRAGALGRRADVLGPGAVTAVGRRLHLVEPVVGDALGGADGAGDLGQVGELGVGEGGHGRGLRMYSTCPDDISSSSLSASQRGDTISVSSSGSWAGGSGAGMGPMAMP